MLRLFPLTRRRKAGAAPVGVGAAVAGAVVAGVAVVGAAVVGAAAAAAVKSGFRRLRRRAVAAAVGAAAVGAAPAGAAAVGTAAAGVGVAVAVGMAVAEVVGNLWIRSWRPQKSVSAIVGNAPSAALEPIVLVAFGPVWVKPGNAYSNHIWSGLPPKPDARPKRPNVREV